MSHLTHINQINSLHPSAHTLPHAQTTKMLRSLLVAVATLLALPSPSTPYAPATPTRRSFIQSAPALLGAGTVLAGGILTTPQPALAFGSKLKDINSKLSAYGLPLMPAPPSGKVGAGLAGRMGDGGGRGYA